MSAGGAVLTLLATIVSLELVRAVRLLRRFADLAMLGRRSSRLLLRSRVSEWAKERAMRLMSLKLLVHSLRTGLLLALVALPLCLALAMVPMPANWASRGLLLAATIGYSLARRRLRLDPQAAERLLQRLTLGAAPVRDVSFDIERATYRGKLHRECGAPPIFVAGMARAGTTILMRLLHESGEFASLSYRDLPFPLAPNLWARLGSKRDVTPAERGHGDGILHDLDSPEAIEEVFWGHFEGRRYRSLEGLTPVPVQPETIAAFRDYVRLVRLRHGGGRYLSKNNNNILRLPALVEAFPRALLVHPFRDPLQQAASLRHQHLRACALAAGDPFRRDFMTWLGHHEFGADQRPFLLAGVPSSGGDRATLDYWVQQWVDVHRFLLRQSDSVAAQQVFVDYDRLCAAQDDLAPVLGARLGVGRGFVLASLRGPSRRPTGDASPALVGEAYDVHTALIERAQPGVTCRRGGSDTRRTVAEPAGAAAQPDRRMSATP